MKNRYNKFWHNDILLTILFKNCHFWERSGHCKIAKRLLLELFFWNILNSSNFPLDARPTTPHYMCNMYFTYYASNTKYYSTWNLVVRKIKCVVAMLMIIFWWKHYIHLIDSWFSRRKYYRKPKEYFCMYIKVYYSIRNEIKPNNPCKKPYYTQKLSCYVMG